MRSGNHRQLKLERIRNMFNRKSLRHFYNKWVSSALKLQNLETGLGKGHKIMQRRRTRNNFNKWKKKAAEIKRNEFIEKKSDWFKSLREGTTKKDVWFSWLLYIKQYQLAKRFLNRANNGIERNLRSEAFFIWRQVLSVQKQ